ncbi:MAG TPA: hypothetical protein VKI64_09860 [Acidimicrobiales bacterium]|nr:hypothetical protein [Acidimicrobiales bacterium]
MRSTIVSRVRDVALDGERAGPRLMRRRREALAPAGEEGHPGTALAGTAPMQRPSPLDAPTTTTRTFRPLLAETIGLAPVAV